MSNLIPNPDYRTKQHIRKTNHKPYFDARFNCFRCGCGYNGDRLGFVLTNDKVKTRKKSKFPKFEVVEFTWVIKKLIRNNYAECVSSTSSKYTLLPEKNFPI